VNITARAGIDGSWAVEHAFRQDQSWGVSWQKKCPVPLGSRAVCCDRSGMLNILMPVFGTFRYVAIRF